MERTVFQILFNLNHHLFFAVLVEWGSPLQLSDLMAAWQSELLGVWLIVFKYDGGSRWWLWWDTRELPAVSKLWNLMIISFSCKGHLPADKVTGPCFFLFGTDTTWKQFMDLAFLVAFYSDSDWCSAVYVFGLFVMVFSSRTTGWYITGNYHLHVFNWLIKMLRILYWTLTCPNLWKQYQFDQLFKFLLLFLFIWRFQVFFFFFFFYDES